jgi:serine/threonine protein kinase
VQFLNSVRSIHIDSFKLVDQIDLLSQLSHPNIVKLIDVTQPKPRNRDPTSTFAVYFFFIFYLFIFFFFFIFFFYFFFFANYFDMFKLA